MPDNATPPSGTTGGEYSGLLGDDELREMKVEADQILAQPVQSYEYRDRKYRGGPRNVDPERALDAAIELTTARVLVEELTDRLEQATIVLLDLCAEQLDAGIPVDSVAEYSGMKHRASVYRALKKLPVLKTRRNGAAALRQRIRSAGT
jgi:hypothetical protein